MIKFTHRNVTVEMRQRDVEDFHRLHPGVDLEEQLIGMINDMLDEPNDHEKAEAART